MLHSDLEGLDEQVVYFGAGLLLLALKLNPSPSDAHLNELAEWIVRREAEFHERRPGTFDRWLLEIGHDPPPFRWEALGKNLASLDLSGRRKQLQEWVKLTGDVLAGATSN